MNVHVEKLDSLHFALFKVKFGETNFVFMIDEQNALIDKGYAHAQCSIFVYAPVSWPTIIAFEENRRVRERVVNKDGQIIKNKVEETAVRRENGVHRQKILLKNTSQL